MATWRRQGAGPGLSANWQLLSSWSRQGRKIWVAPTRGQQGFWDPCLKEGDHRGQEPLLHLQVRAGMGLPNQSQRLGGSDRVQSSQKQADPCTMCSSS